VGTKFDVSELSRELAALRSRPHAHKFAFILPLAPGLRDTARAFLAEGPPFDIKSVGLESHEVFLSDDEVIFVFGSLAGVDALELILNDDEFWAVVSSWEHIAAGRPRVAEIAYDWRLTGT
jgi:hypothetical protein